MCDPDPCTQASHSHRTAPTVCGLYTISPPAELLESYCIVSFIIIVIVVFIIIIYLRTQAGTSGTNKITRKNKCSTGQ